MTGIIKKSLAQSYIDGYTIVDVDSGDIGNYPIKNVMAGFKRGCTIGNLRLYNGKVHIENGLEADRFPIRVIQSSGDIQLVKNQYAITIIGRLNNGNIAVIAQDNKAREITYRQLYILLSTKKISLQNAELKIDNQQVEILSKGKGFIQDESNYPKIWEIQQGISQNSRNIETSNNTEEFKDIFKISKSIDNRYILQGFKDADAKEKLNGVLNIPEGIAYIDDKAFMDETTIRKVIMPKSLRTIGRSAFECQSVEEVVLNDGLITIKHSAFRYCRKLEKINFPSQLAHIHSYAFQSQGITQCELKGDLTVIGEYSFSGLGQLKEITIDAPKCNIEQDAFSGQLINKAVIISAGIIKQFAFRNCQKLKTFETKGPVRQIKYAVFAQDPYISEIRLGEGLKSMQVCPFNFVLDLKNPLNLYEPEEVITDEEDPRYYNVIKRDIYLPNSLEKLLDIKKETARSVDYRWQLSGYKVHIQPESKVYQQLKKLDYMMSDIGGIDIVETSEGYEEQESSLAKRARILGKSPVEMIIDSYNKEKAQVDSKLRESIDTKVIDKQLLYNIDELNTENLYSDYKLSEEQCLLLGIPYRKDSDTSNEYKQKFEQLSCLERYTENYKSWLGVKLLNWIQSTQKSAKEAVNILVNTNIDELKRQIAGRVFGIDFEYRGDLIEVHLIIVNNRLMRKMVQMVIVTKNREYLIFSAVPDFWLTDIPCKVSQLMKEIMLDKLCINDEINGLYTLRQSSYMRVFQETIRRNQQVSVCKAFQEVLLDRQIQVQLNKELYVYLPAREIVIKLKSDGKVNEKAGLCQIENSQCNFIVLEQTNAKDQEIFKVQNKSKGLNDFKKQIDQIYEANYNSQALQKQKPAKIAKVIAQNIEELIKVQKFELSELTKEQMIGVMDQELIEPIDSKEAIDIIDRYSIKNKEGLIEQGEWKLKVFGTSKSQRFKKVTIPNQVKQQEHKQFIYVLETDSEAIYGKSTYSRSFIEHFICEYIKAVMNIRNPKIRNNNYLLEYKYGTFAQTGTENVYAHCSGFMGIENIRLRYNRSTVLSFEINPINGCTYLIGKLLGYQANVLMPISQLEDGINFFKTATKTDERRILSYLSILITHASKLHLVNVQRGYRELLELIHNGQTDRKEYERVIGVWQSLYDCIAVNQDQKLVEIDVQ